MQDQTDGPTHPTPPRSPDTEAIAPPRGGHSARIGASLFTLLLVATLLAPVVLDTETMPGIALVNLGLALSVGFSELVDPGSRGFQLALRLGGIAIALLGLLIQML